MITVYKDHLAENMGLEPGDVILKVGGIKIQHMGALMYWFEKMQFGGNVYFSINRDGQDLLKSAVILARPFETSRLENEVIYDAFRMESGLIRTIVNRPPGINKGPAILFIQDYTCHSIDMAGRDYHPYLKLADEFVKQGFVFIRVEKLGLGDSKTDIPCFESGYKEEGKVFAAGMKYVKNLDFVEKDKITILAQGFGGNQVLNALEGGHPEAIIFWGFYNDFTNDACIPLRDKKYWKEVEIAKNHKNWNKLNSRVLFQHPEFDVFDNDGKDAESLNEYLVSKGKNSTYEVLRESSHYFQKVFSKDNPTMTLGSYFNPEFFKENFNYEIVPYMVKWLSENKKE